MNQLCSMNDKFNKSIQGGIEIMRLKSRSQKEMTFECGGIECCMSLRIYLKQGFWNVSSVSVPHQKRFWSHWILIHPFHSNLFNIMIVSHLSWGSVSSIALQACSNAFHLHDRGRTFIKQEQPFSYVVVILPIVRDKKNLFAKLLNLSNLPKKNYMFGQPWSMILWK